MAPDQLCSMELVMPLPAMSFTEPCNDSNSEVALHKDDLVGAALGKQLRVHIFVNVVPNLECPANCLRGHGVMVGSLCLITP